MQLDNKKSYSHSFACFDSVEIRIGPLHGTMVLDLQCWMANWPLGPPTQSYYAHSSLHFVVLDFPVRSLPSSMAGLIPCDRIVQLGVFCRQDSYRLIILVTVNSDSCFCGFSYKGNLTLLHANTLTLPAGSFLRKKFINIKYKNNIERKCVYNQQEHLAKLLILRHLKQISLKVRVSSTSKTIRNLVK